MILNVEAAVGMILNVEAAVGTILQISNVWLCPAGTAAGQAKKARTKSDARMWISRGKRPWEERQCGTYIL